MEHLSLARLGLLGGESSIQDPEELKHLQTCDHCTRLLRWFGDDQLTDLLQESDFEPTIEFTNDDLVTVARSSDHRHLPA